MARAIGQPSPGRSILDPLTKVGHVGLTVAAPMCAKKTITFGRPSGMIACWLPSQSSPIVGALRPRAESDVPGSQGGRACPPLGRFEIQLSLVLWWCPGRCGCRIPRGGRKRHTDRRLPIKCGDRSGVNQDWESVPADIHDEESRARC